MKTKKIKARKMWGSETDLFRSRESATQESLPWKPDTYFVIPADAASVEAMVAQGAKAIAEYNTAPGKEVMIIPCDVAIARIVLAAIGIKGGAK